MTHPGFRSKSSMKDQDPAEPSLARTGSLPLSIVIITLNEERHLERCLQSLPRGSEVVVLDSGSTDQTEAIARRFGVQFASRAFTTHAAQKNAALVMTSRPWILFIDADEEMTSALRIAIEAVVKGTGAAEVSGYSVRRRLVFMGRVMHFGRTVDTPLRLIRRNHGVFESDNHESIVMKRGKVERLTAELLHYSYDDLTDYFHRFNDYTSKVAASHKKNGKTAPTVALLAMRPWFEFFVRYVLRLGFLDGYPGYCYALVSSFYTFVKYAKLKELAASSPSS